MLPLFRRYESVVIGNGLANQVSNPDVDVDITKPDMVIRSQIAVLREMTTRLKAAYSGNDISVPDDGDGELRPVASERLLALRSVFNIRVLVSVQMTPPRRAAEGGRAAAAAPTQTRTSTSPLRQTPATPG